MNDTEALRELDKIEQLDPDPTIDAGALELMERIGETPDGLRVLVDRYSSSPSANIVGYLALMLSLKSSYASMATATLAFECAAKLEGSDNDEALLSVINAMTNQIAFGRGWGNSPSPPASFFPFLQHRLSFSGRLKVLVQFGAIELITTICYRGVLQTALTAEQIKWIRTKLEGLSVTDDTLLKDAIEEFEECDADD
jgi:hypothetical protein